MTAHVATFPASGGGSGSVLAALTTGALSRSDRTRLLNGEILVEAGPHTHWGAAATARLFLPCRYAAVWAQIIDYPRWVAFFPDITHSEVVEGQEEEGWKRLYQKATKNFLIFQAQADIYLKVLESRVMDSRHQIQFRMERGTFEDFSADLHLEAYRDGTLLTYHVEATPNIPVPSVLMQQAIRMDLPANLEQMRRVIQQAVAIA